MPLNRNPIPACGTYLTLPHFLPIRSPSFPTLCTVKSNAFHGLALSIIIAGSEYVTVQHRRILWTFAGVMEPFRCYETMPESSTRRFVK